jgi:hypothetical protein
MTNHRDNLRRSGSFRTAHRRVYFFRVELATFLILLLAACDLIPFNNAADPFHIRHDEYTHEFSLR